MTQEERNQLVDKIIDEEKRGHELLPNMGRFAKGYSKFGLRLSTRVFVFTLFLAVCLCYINGPLFLKNTVTRILLAVLLVVLCIMANNRLIKPLSRAQDMFGDATADYATAFAVYDNELDLKTINKYNSHILNKMFFASIMYMHQKVFKLFKKNKDFVNSYKILTDKTAEPAKRDQAIKTFEKSLDTIEGQIDKLIVPDIETVNKALIEKEQDELKAKIKEKRDQKHAEELDQLVKDVYNKKIDTKEALKRVSEIAKDDGTHESKQDSNKKQKDTNKDAK